MNKKLKITAVVVAIIGFVSLAVWYLKRTNIPVLEPKGPVGLQERNLLLFALGLSLVVVIPVFSLLFFIVWKYRESNTKAKYSPDFDHSVIAETVWWLIPAALIAILSVVAWNSSHTLDPYRPLKSKNPQITIQVVALDWKWLFIYPEQNIATVNMVQFPKNTPVDFEITSDSVMNSFWIPQLGGQIYSMPGMSTQLHLMASQYGSFNGLSANISGAGFAGMTFVAKSTSAQSFSRWTRSVQASHHRLTMAMYNRLLRPSEYNNAAYYSSPQTNLYDTIVDKYGMSSMGGDQSMSGMVMQ